MKYAFTTQSEIFMILDLMQGGDLAFHLRRRRKFTEDEARYYVARTVLGVGALHEHQIVYRDLKPENILMDEEGRTKISDMGLAYKMPKSGISGTCGTRGYWAPEMLRRDANGKKEKYNLSVDWFSLGVCTYEFLYGIGPFRTERAKNWGDFAKIEKADREKAIDLAIREMEPEYEETISPEAIDLIQSLLKKNPNERLGSNGGAVEIMSHPWFSSIEWDNLNTCKAPIIPTKDINMQTQSEIGSFSDEKSAKQLDLNEQDHKHYEKWDYVSIKSFQQEMVDFLYFEELGNSSDSLNNSNKGCCTIS
jgi:serine/threonine protein kinase